MFVSHNAAFPRHLFQDNTPRIRIAQFRDHVVQRVGEIIDWRKRHAHTRAEPAASEVEDIID